MVKLFSGLQFCHLQALNRFGKENLLLSGALIVMIL
jgi:hypothetical protein